LFHGTEKNVNFPFFTTATFRQSFILQTVINLKQRLKIDKNGKKLTAVNAEHHSPGA